MIAETMKDKAVFRYIAALHLFGSNGIVASYISLTSYEIVFTRTLIGGLFLVLIFISSKQKVRFWRNKPNFLYLVISGAAMGASWLFLFEAYAQIGVSIPTAEACTQETVDNQGSMIQLLAVFSARPITPTDGYEPRRVTSLCFNRDHERGA